MHYLSAAGAYLSSVFSPVAQENRLDQLTLAERSLFEKVVKEILIHVSSPRLVDLNNQTPQRCFALIFRKTESWKTVETELTRVSCSSNDYRKQWADRWLSRIKDLRGLHSKVLSHGRLLLAEKQKPHPNLQDSDRIRAVIRNTTQEIKRCLAIAFAVLDADASDKGLTSNMTCLKIITFLKDKQQHLSVFSDGLSLSMDTKELVFQVKEIQPGVNLDSQLNHSTKVIITFEETSLKKVGTNGSNVKLQTEELGFRNCYEALSRKKIEVPSLQRAYYDLPLLDQSPGSSPARLKKTSVGQSLHRLVNWAIEDVNTRLDQTAP